MPPKKKSALDLLKAAFGSSAIPDTIAEPEPVYDELTLDATKRTALLMVQSLPLRKTEGGRPAVTRKCVECGHVFRTDYLYDTYCSYSCLSHYLKASTGIVFDPTRQHWDFTHPPAKMPPQAMDAMMRFCRAFIAEYDRVLAESQPETPLDSVNQSRTHLIQGSPDQEELPEAVGRVAYSPTSFDLPLSHSGPAKATAGQKRPGGASPMIRHEEPLELDLDI